uniref:BZIP domain-containing protein n=1 Tax=Kalanchoe fedtschenkoi TaxID=63787 RepID=A0A7N0UM38_KALFE
MSDAGVFDDGFDPELMKLLEDSLSPPEEASTESAPSWFGEIENMLMNDDAEIDGQLEDDVDPSYVDQFMSDVLLDVPADVAVDGDLLSPSDGKSNQSDLSNFNGGSENETEAAHADANGDDPDSKKRKRQLRNRDAALRSRERKKMYVKDLELKSRYLEGECRRLGRLLQCCYAENQDLRFRLHLGNGAAGAAMTKQESAVLLLGMDLHLFHVIVCSVYILALCYCEFASYVNFII